VVLVANMMEFKDPMIVYSAFVAGQGLFVFQELVSIFLKLLLGSGHQANK
jgi:hypothetical protein